MTITHTIKTYNWKESKQDYTIFQKWHQNMIDYLKKQSEYKFRTVTAFNKTIELKKDLTAIVSKADDLICFDNEYLDIHCFGNNVLEARKEFLEMFIADKEQYYDCDENELSESGKIQRNRIATYL